MNTEIFEFYRDDVLLPDIKGLGWCDTARPCLGGRRSDGLDYLEIGYLHRGAVEWLEGDELTQAGPNSMIIDWPGDWQGGENALIHPCQRYWVRIDMDDIPRLPGMEPRTAEALLMRILAFDRRHFPVSPVMHVWFEQLLRQQRNPEPFGVELSRAALHQILFTMVNDHGQVHGAARSRAVTDAVGYISDHLSETFSVGELAGRVGLSAGYFHELFLRETGSTPARFLAEKRIAEAKHRLVRKNASITDISVDLGFSSSQYFATVFKRFVGLTPGAYRRMRMRGSRARTFSELAAPQPTG